ncbi:MAG: hypothetical protein U0U09_02150 [Cyclobacteriaceae bacterium]
MRPVKSLIALLLTCTAAMSAFAQITLGDVPPGRVAIAAFTVDQPEKITIKGTAGLFAKDWQPVAYYAWILNSETREVIWRMGDKFLKEDLDFGKFDIDDEASLKKGSYELYFTAAYAQRNDDQPWTTSVKNNINYVFSSHRWDRSIQQDMNITLTGKNLVPASFRDIIRKKTEDAVVSIQRPEHNANAKVGFSLAAETTLKVYAIGEARKDENFDFAWITDLDKGKRVWEMTYANSEFAGGADKNILVDTKITLPAGNYLVSYVTDDSHAYNDWNMMPPDDPQFSGITLWADAATKKNVVPFKAPEQLKPVVAITRVGDDDFFTKGLTVKSAVDVRILCIGEESSSSSMADGGWIINAATREMVWDFNRGRTTHAGGAEKNRMFDGTVHLDKGDYLVYYSSDESHSYGQWNSGPPYEQDYWGITVWATRKEDLAKLSTFDPEQYKNTSILAEIVQVRDDEDRFKTFKLSQDTRVRILAIGEGSDGDMDDYGWIENTDTGRTVWEMTYRSTTHAGGASKNRMFNDIIILPKGEYRLHYQTDSSHSYRDWNASPPNDQEQYGISIFKATINE